ncbi:hypothetical protein [Butyrivibrio sp.]|nr:hypothetical protein [Butyrivibrio sp.]
MKSKQRILFGCYAMLLAIIVHYLLQIRKGQLNEADKNTIALG